VGSGRGGAGLRRSRIRIARGQVLT
jgi:hypothetical protein